MRFAPKHVFAAAVAVVAIVAIAALGLALRAPMLGIQLEANQQAGLRVATIAAGAPNFGRLAPGTHITAFLDENGQTISLDADLLIEEPDQLEAWPRYNDFMERQSRLARAANKGTLVAVTDDGRHIDLQIYDRSIADVPRMFWVQMAVGLIAYLIAAGVWAFRTRDRAAVYFALASIGLLLSATAAAVYSTRELILDGALLRPLSLINCFGALFFTASLLSLLWNYPRRLARFPLEIPAYGLMLLAWSSAVWEFAPDMAWAEYIPILILFAPTFLLAYFQWRSTRQRPVERAALKWFLLSVYLGTGLFAAIVLIPLALGIAPIASQGIMFIVFLLMFIGIALGITRYRLFDLDRWWFSAWLWLLGGAAVIILDFVLVSLLSTTQFATLGISLAIVGWAYFPLRQWLMGRFSGRPHDKDHDILTITAGDMLAATSMVALELSWNNVLHRLFEPLELESRDQNASEIALDEYGQTLLVPSLGNAKALVLRYPQRGGRLFNPADVQLAHTALGLARFIADALNARDSGMREERQRIMRDMHDDLGAKLLGLIHTAGGGEREVLARSAMQDMRDALTALEAEPCTLSEALGVLRAELENRGDQLGFELDWNDADLPEDVVIGARARTNLCRILREAVTNAVRHGHATQIAIRFWMRTSVLHFSAGDNSGNTALEGWTPGRGMRSMQKRARELGGEIAWLSNTGKGCRMEGYFHVK